MNKEELLDALDESRDSLLDLIEDLPDEAYLEPGVIGEWTLKDVLAHLVAWEAELVKFLWQVKQGSRPTSAQMNTPPDSEARQARNEKWRSENANRPLERIWDDLEAVRKQTQRRLEPFNDQDLSDPTRFPWAKGKPLWAWVAENSFEHENEHRAQIAAWLAGRARPDS